jgi:hypothetical protein
LKEYLNDDYRDIVELIEIMVLLRNKRISPQSVPCERVIAVKLGLKPKN